ncbi:hypothetical protein [Terrabacter sp. 2RAF25]|uniref:hypothetical protein n=1 Tax=Terrabacter sp. 2RAF25 TaxID=3232998 RepID=UPI003F9DEFBC
MNRSSTIGRLGPVVAAVIALGVAGGSAVVAGGATGGTAPEPAAVASRVSSSGPSPAECTSMTGLAADAAGATSASGTAASVHAARGRAAAVARATRSDDVREAAQNLADDLAAYRVALTTMSGDPAEAAHRRADINIMIRGHVATMRRLCGR